MVTEITNSEYKGFEIMIVELFLLIVVFYIYEDEVMFDSEKMNIQRIRIRAGETRNVEECKSSNFKIV